MKRRGFIFGSIAAGLAAAYSFRSMPALTGVELPSKKIGKKVKKWVRNQEYENAQYEVRFIDKNGGTTAANGFLGVKEYPYRFNLTKDGQYRMILPFVEA